MGMFQYKNYSSAQSVALLQQSHKLAAHTSLSGVMGMPTKKIFQWGADNFLSKEIYSNTIDLHLPKGWRELTPSDLKLPQSALDFSGYFHIKSPLTGNTPTGPQAKVLGQFDDNGALTKLSIGFAGTNSPVDVIDYFQMNEGKIAPNMQPLLQAVKEYAQENALTGEDVLITGYSLGGGMTNIMARFKETLADGFFKDSDYVGHASPLIYDDGSVFNMGYENDAVYRIVGNEANMLDALKATKFGFVNPDKMFDSSVDNLVVFNDTYASPFWKITPFSILNLVAWSGHISGMFVDTIARVSQSPFYEFTHQDSTVIIDNLSAMTRWYTWVEDKASHTSDHYNKPAFIFGNEHNNLLKSGANGDYIDAGGGDDTIKLATGADRVAGGAGVDKVILSGDNSDWTAYRLEDGTLFLNPKDDSGIKQLHDVEKISLQRSIFENTYDVTADALVKNSSDKMQYAAHLEGSAGDDELTGSVVFGGAGDDVIRGDSRENILHGGEGDDKLFGGAGKNNIYGAEGDDYISISSDSTENILFGGVGNDTFHIENAKATTIIKDFNAYSGDNDLLSFSKELFSDNDAVLAASSQQGKDVHIALEYGNVVIANSTIDDLGAANAIIIV